MSWKWRGLAWKVTWARVDRSSSSCTAVAPGQGHPFLPWLLNQEKGVGSVYFLRWFCEFSEVPQVPIRVRGHLGKVSFC